MITSSQVVSGIQNATEENFGLNLYPNPANTEIQIELSVPLNSDAMFIVSDLPGRQLINKNVSLVKGKQNITLDLSTLDSGSYLFQLHTSQGSVSRKFVVVK